ncbi:hypothetical protein DPEC_G00302670 [Dallia pectoralis]|uniref:Uncharacterized protein n=1 Tax=Dallia pectoralis TaxID=75939 RepID=A0ACC2FH57_DALPE|nr:hypothetical protein DPEC_G00302670 [Dallia pectoralis]
MSWWRPRTHRWTVGGRRGLSASRVKMPEKEARKFLHKATVFYGLETRPDEQAMHDSWEPGSAPSPTWPGLSPQQRVSATTASPGTISSHPDLYVHSCHETQ